MVRLLWPRSRGARGGVEVAAVDEAAEGGGRGAQVFRVGAALDGGGVSDLGVLLVALRHVHEDAYRLGAVGRVVEPAYAVEHARQPAHGGITVIGGPVAVHEQAAVGVGREGLGKVGEHAV